MSGKRVLFFGVTGIKKAKTRPDDEDGILDRLATWAQRHRARPKPRVLDFEAEYLFNPDRDGKEWFSFLDDEQRAQREIWHRTWERFQREVLAQDDNDLFVGLHGCIVRDHYGVRSVLAPQRVAECVKPDLIVTLIDNVYDMWWRTERRAGGEEYPGRPSVEQLVFARRAELIVADQVAYSLRAGIPQFLISVAHPCETLANRIYSPKPMVVYLCFPISAPRDLARAGDDSGTEEVCEFLRMAYDRERSNPDLVVVCPLGIDELPLVAVTRESLDAFPSATSRRGVRIGFDRESLHWPMHSVWSPDGCLSPGPVPATLRPDIPLEQLEVAAGMIQSDVGWRDYRLVEQSKGGCLGTFNPKFKNRQGLSRSVRREIDFAAGICPVFAFQDPAHDPQGKFDEAFPQDTGTMQRVPREKMVIRKSSVKELLDAVEKLARRKSR